MPNKHDFSTSLEILDSLIDDYKESLALNHTYMDIEIEDFDTIQDDLRFLIECYEKAGVNAQFNKIKADEALEASLEASRERVKKLEKQIEAEKKYRRAKLGGDNGTILF